MKSNDVFPSRWLKASDLNGKCRAIMNTVEMQPLGDDGDKPVLFFSRAQVEAVKQKGLVLNQTNWNLIAGMYGDESNDWKDKEVTLFPTKVPFGNKLVDAIRIEFNHSAPIKNGPVQAKPKPMFDEANPPPRDDFNDEVPF